MTNLRDEIDALKAEVERLNAKVAKATPEPYPSDAEAAKWADRMHQMREARASRAAASAFSPEDLRAMQAACPDATMRAIGNDNRAPTGRPGVIPTNYQTSDVRGGGTPGSGSGWAREVPLSNPPGMRWVDAQLDAQDAKDLEQRIKELAALKAAEKP